MSTPTIDIYKLFSRDAESAENGKWFWLVENEMGFKVRAAGAEAVIEYRDTLIEPYQNLIKATGELPKEVREDIGFKVMANAIVVDWKGIPAEDGSLIPFSTDAAYALFKKLEPLADFVIAQSNNAQLFKNEQREATAGN